MTREADLQALEDWYQLRLPNALADVEEARAAVADRRNTLESRNAYRRAHEGLMQAQQAFAIQQGVVESDINLLDKSAGLDLALAELNELNAKYTRRKARTNRYWDVQDLVAVTPPPEEL